MPNLYQNKIVKRITTSEHKLIYFWLNPRAFWPSIDSNTITTFKAQKDIEDFAKIVHVTSVVQL